jgi:hypothetical protein
MSREREQARDQSPSAMRKLLIGIVGVGAVVGALVGKAVVKGGKAAVRVGEEIVEHGSQLGATRAAVFGGRAAVKAATKLGDRDHAGAQPPIQFTPPQR